MKVLSQNDVVTYPHVFKWVYGNPLTFLVGIRRIPAYLVDYTTVYIYVYVCVCLCRCMYAYITVNLFIG